MGFFNRDPTRSGEASPRKSIPVRITHRSAYTHILFLTLGALDARETSPDHERYTNCRKPRLNTDTRLKLELPQTPLPPRPEIPPRRLAAPTIATLLSAQFKTSQISLLLRHRNVPKLHDRLADTRVRDVPSKQDPIPRN
jgi:hypothetical protein